MFSDPANLELLKETNDLIYKDLTLFQNELRQQDKKK